MVVFLFTILDKCLCGRGFFLTMKLEYFWDELELVFLMDVYESYLCIDILADIVNRTVCYADDLGQHYWLVHCRWKVCTVVESIVKALKPLFRVLWKAEEIVIFCHVHGGDPGVVVIQVHDYVQGWIGLASCVHVLEGREVDVTENGLQMVIQGCFRHSSPFLHVELFSVLLEDANFLPGRRPCRDGLHSSWVRHSGQWDGRNESIFLGR